MGASLNIENGAIPRPFLEPWKFALTRSGDSTCFAAYARKTSGPPGRLGGATGANWFSQSAPKPQTLHAMHAIFAYIGVVRGPSIHGVECLEMLSDDKAAGFDLCDRAPSSQEKPPTISDSKLDPVTAT